MIIGDIISMAFATIIVIDNVSTLSIRIVGIVIIRNIQAKAISHLYWSSTPEIRHFDQEYPKKNYIDDTAVLTGDVKLAIKSSVWHGSTIHGNLYLSYEPLADGYKVKVKPYSQICSNVTIHANGNPSSLPTVIGRRSVIKEGCLLEDCVIDPLCYIGTGSIIGKGCHICRGSMITPGSILLPNVLVPKGEIWGGIPACKIRDVTEEDRIRVTREWRELAEQSKSFINEDEDLDLTQTIDSSNSSNSSNVSDSSNAIVATDAISDLQSILLCYSDKLFGRVPRISASDYNVGDDGGGDFGDFGDFGGDCGDDQVQNGSVFYLCLL